MKDWTAVIPVAGVGSRLNSVVPKALYKIEGRPLLWHVITLLEKYCDQFVFVTSVANTSDIADYVRTLLPDHRVSYAIQYSLAGTANAVAVGLRHVTSLNTLVMWGDLINVQPATIEACIATHAAATVPTVLVPDPYIHIQKEHGRIISVLHKREQVVMPETGEADIGVFMFRTWVLERYLNMLLIHGTPGKGTGEVSFLDIFPFIDREQDVAVRLLQIASPMETCTINTEEDVIRWVNRNQKS